MPLEEGPQPEIHVAYAWYRASYMCAAWNRVEPLSAHQNANRLLTHMALNLDCIVLNCMHPGFVLMRTGAGLLVIVASQANTCLPSASVCECSHI